MLYIGNLARYTSKPTKAHWTALKRVLRYLKGATHYGILYSRNKSTICVGYSDSDWAGDVNDRKSTSGYLFQVSGGAVTWKSNKQSCVALSTAEAEYVALSSAAHARVRKIKIAQKNYRRIGESSNNPNYDL